MLITVLRVCIRGLAAGALLLALAACGDGTTDAATSLPAATRQQIDDIVRTHLAAGEAPGASVLVDIPGEGRYVQTYGSADLATGQPPRAGDPFRIASITKTFTATAVLQLAAQGRLALDEPLARWYPGFPGADRITVDHLLRMRSGIADSADTAFLAEYFHDPLLALTPDDMIARAAARNPAFEPPDRRTVYTNVNYILLERIAVAVDGRPLDAQLAERVYRLLGMTHTVYPGSAQTALGGMTRGYALDTAGGSLIDRTVLNPEPPGGAGAMVSTLDDLARYARALCTGEGLLPPAWQSRRLQGSTIDGASPYVRYGAGVELLGRFCGHNGTIMGFSSEMFYLPDKDAVVVINVNRLDLDDRSRSGALFRSLTRLLFPGHVEW